MRYTVWKSQGKHSGFRVVRVGWSWVLSVLTLLLLLGGPRISSHGIQGPSKVRRNKEDTWVASPNKCTRPSCQGDAWSRASSGTETCHLLPGQCSDAQRSRWHHLKAAGFPNLENHYTLGSNVPTRIVIHRHIWPGTPFGWCLCEEDSAPERLQWGGRKGQLNRRSYWMNETDLKKPNWNSWNDPNRAYGFYKINSLTFS